MFKVLWISGLLSALCACGGGGGGGGGSLEPSKVDFQVRPESRSLTGAQGTFVSTRVDVFGTSLNPRFWIDSGCPPAATCAVAGAGAGRHFYVQMYGTDTPPGSYDVEMAAQHDDVFHVPSDIERARVHVDVLTAEIAWSYRLATYPAGPDPRQLAPADFDNDGLGDVAVRNRPDARSSIGLSLLLGVVGGGFSAPRTLETAFLDAIAAGDFNGDGNSDIATVEQADGQIRILYGNGSGGFSPWALGTFRSPFWLSAVDLDADGYDDLLVSMQPHWPDSSVSAVSIFYGAAIGFSEPASFDFGDSDGVVPAIVADFTADGILDLMLRHGSGFTPMQGTGTRDFAAIDDVDVDAYTTSIWNCRFDRDPYEDLLTVRRESPLPSPGTPVSVEVLEGTGSGFTAGARVTAGPSGSPLGADLNGDGACDVMRTGSGIVNVLFGSGDGEFLGQISRAFPSGAGAVYAANRDGDASEEVIGIDSDTDSVFVLDSL